MTAAKWVTHAHTEAARKLEAAGALANAEQHIRKMIGATTRDRIAKMTPATGDAGVNIRNVTATQQNAALPTKAAPQTVNSNGLATKPTVPAIMGVKKPVVISDGIVTMPGADRSRTPAKSPTSTATESPFVSVAVTGIGKFRPGEIEHLAGFGISPGVVAGLLSLKREHVDTAVGIVQQARGGQ